MSKIIKAQKLMINVDTESIFSDAILIYQIKDSITGEVSIQTKTISVKSIINVPIISIILENAINFATEQEN